MADCEGKGTNFSGLDAEQLAAYHVAFESDVMEWLNPRAAAERRTSMGGTAPREIANQVNALRGWLGE